MKSTKPVLAVLLSFLLTGLSSAQSLNGLGHIVPPDELRTAVRQAASERESNIETIETFLRSPEVSRVLEEQVLPMREIREAVPLLSNAELAQLADQARKVEGDIAAGALDNQQITYIIIALVTAVIILVLVDD